MSEATNFAPPTGVRWADASQTYGQVQYGDDSKLVVIFYERPLFNKVESIKRGVRFYDNATYVKIHAPGELLNVVDRPVTQADTHRFRAQWNLFLQGKLQVPDGTPIDLLFPNNPAAADNLRAFGVHTIQQCAELSAHALDRIGMGGQEYKNMAVRYLSNAQSGAVVIQMQEQLRQKDQEIKVLNQKLEHAIATIQDINYRMENPGINRMHPVVMPGVDIAKERIDNNHPTAELTRRTKGKGKGKKTPNFGPPKDEIDQSNIITQVSEEDFETVDVTKGD